MLKKIKNVRLKKENAKNTATELVFILDRSGSMGGLEKDTIGGFNSMIEKQKKESGKCYVTTVLFDHEISVLHDRDRKSTRLNSSHPTTSRMPSSA